MSPSTAPSYHVVLRAGPADVFALEVPTGAVVVDLRMDGALGAQGRVDEDVWEPLRQAGIAPSQEAVDFFRFATAAYCADLLVPHKTAFDAWSRHIVLHLPVDDPERWTAAAEALTGLLDFLSGDFWEVRFRGMRVPPPPRPRRMRRTPTPIEASRVCLLSGGLDSAIGGADLLAGGHTVAFVSHNAKSGGASFSSPAQDAVLAALRAHNTPAAIRPLRFRLHPPPPVKGVTANVTTTRSRSIIFFALGLLAASALDAAHGGNPVPLVIPENGLISLNVPLTRARLGSWSTRTTHPHTLAMLRDVMARLGLATPLETPYHTVTKGEMLHALAQRDRVLAQELVAATVSCAHPNESRYLPVDQRRSHCGVCVPCIIRRAAAQHAGVDDARYTFDLPADIAALRERESDRAADPVAFLYALATRHRPARPFDLAKSGPLHIGSAEELHGLLRVYDAGMDEVARHLAVPIQ